MIHQRFVPELQKLRRHHYHAERVAFPSPGDSALFLPAEASGVQLEIAARISFAASAHSVGRFGLRVLANDASSEYTEVGFQRGVHDRVFVDRRRSSGGVRDADVRAGPWLNASTAAQVQLHLYVDRSIVTLIVDNSTTFSLWVHPTTPRESTRVALFVDSGEGEAEGVAGLRAETIDVWQLASPAH